MRLSTIILATLFVVPVTLNAAEKAKKEKKNKNKVSLYGHVYDSFTRGKVKAFITLMNADSTVVDTMTCNTSERGTWSVYQFYVPRVEKPYIIKTTADGYEDKYTDYDLVKLGRNNWMEVPEILMKRKQNDVYKDVDLEGVVVKGTRIQVAYRGDTIIYDASAFKLPEGSMLDGLIRQLPGAELKDNGDIYINGKKIDFLTLNGKDFFKGDNKVMLENLPYFTVKDLKVFYRDTEKNKMMGKEIEEKNFVMDVTLKREYARGYLANAEAGVGTENRWTAKAFGMYYDDHTRLSVYGNANNVNENRTPGSDGDWDPKKVSDGVRTTRRTGLNLNTEDKEKKISENLSVDVSWNDADNERKTFAETFADNGSIFSNSWSANRNKDFNINVNNTLHFPKKLIGIYSYLYYASNKSTSASADSTYSTTLTNRNEAIGMTRRKYISTSQSAWWAYKFDSGDYLQLSVSGSYDNTSPNDNYNNIKTYYASTGTTEVRNRFMDARSMSYGYNVNVDYSFQFPNSWMLALSPRYSQNYISNHNDRYNLERLPESDYDAIGWLPSLREDMMTAYDTDNSRSYTTMKRRYQGAVYIQRYTKDMSFYVTLPYSHRTETMNYMGNALDTIARRSWNEFAPSVNFRTRGTTQRPVKFSYSTRITPPSFASLMPLRDTSNPLSISISNPDLKNMVTHSMDGRITFKNDSLASSIYVGFETGIVRNAIGNRTVYDASTGTYTRMSDNVNGNWNAFVNSGWQRPLDADRRFRMDLYGKAEYERSVDFATVTSSSSSNDGGTVTESPISKVDNVNLIASAKFTYKLGDFSAGVNGKITSRHTRGELDIVRSVDANDMQYGANATYTVPTLRITIATDLTMYSRRGYESDMMNTDELVWNAQLSRSFFKGALTAKVQAYDLLQQLNSRRYNVNAQGRTETWYNYIPRYVMFSLAYKFTKKPKKS